MRPPYPVSRSPLLGLIAAVTLSLIAPSTQAVIFEPPEDPAPDSTLGGGSRDPQQCVAVQEGLLPVTPLLPESQMGFTVAQKPTIYLYVPQTVAQKVFFSLQTETGESHYQQEMELPKTPGIMGFQLPEDAPPLKENVNYKWAIAFICGEMLQPDSPEYTGWIRRLPQQEYSISSDLSLKQVEDLAQAQLWYDTVFSLVQLKLQEPDNSVLTENWAELLSSVGLEAIADQPILKFQP
ncbi:DUF928 domain-containing protein [Roseofilum sp. BLCC_M154]|uniref:DUF928 domain-containing protein n=1 Tax=Roseofilum acuticapitatum BLCC-M154 TaxID=3022444 RepID=A0ABT7AXI4_9CYAN|nr:DUF928 domain-containing protein [Roseofilum acuticapitatum]MDJ1171624.1 DUF928 domain-containing protein [Roseofilum acuticapitatum BLCC-M154]